MIDTLRNASSSEADEREFYNRLVPLSRSAAESRRHSLTWHRYDNVINKRDQVVIPGAGERKKGTRADEGRG